MEDIVLVDALLLLPGHRLHMQRRHLHLKQGVLVNISEEALHIPDAHYIASPHLCVSWGWFDLRAYLPDPGYEQKETLSSGRAAAAAGGFTEVAILPNTRPVIDNKDTLSYVMTGNSQALVQLHPIAALTRSTEGKQLTEMIDLYTHGAVAFSEGLGPLYHCDLMLKALQYLQPLDALLMQRPEEVLLTRYGQMNEGTLSIELGMKGIPALAEHLMIARDLRLLEYTGGRLHFSCLSSAESVDMLRQAKARGLAVSADVSAAHLFFEESVLSDFDTTYKLNPPLRTATDRQALWQGLRDGTIDAIVSDHQPQEVESKQVEFDQAAFGMSTIETVLPMSRMQSGLAVELIVEKLSVAPRKLLKRPLPPFEQDSIANLTIFDPEAEWHFTHSRSQSPIQPLLGKLLKGKVIGVVNNGQMQWFI